MDSTQELDELGKDVAARGVRCGIAAAGRRLPAVSLGYSAFALSLDIQEGPPHRPPGWTGPRSQSRTWRRLCWWCPRGVCGLRLCCGQGTSWGRGLHAVRAEEREARSTVSFGGPFLWASGGGSEPASGSSCPERSVCGSGSAVGPAVMRA